VLFKLDFAKAYTKILWDFLFGVMEVLGWQGVHMVCILFLEVKVVMNERHSIVNFQFEKEFGKDIPYLSILVGEAFNVLLKRVVENKKIKG